MNNSESIFRNVFISRDLFDDKQALESFIRNRFDTIFSTDFSIPDENVFVSNDKALDARKRVIDIVKVM